MDSVSRSERFTPAEVSRLLSIHPATTWRWILTGVRGRKLGSFMVGGRRYISRKQLDDFLTSRSVGPVASEAAQGAAREAGHRLDAAGVTPRLLPSAAAARILATRNPPSREG